MNDEKWARFFDLVTEIVSQDGDWQDKAAELNRQAKRHGAADDLQELALWADE